MLNGAVLKRRKKKKERKEDFWENRSFTNKVMPSPRPDALLHWKKDHKSCPNLI